MRYELPAVERAGGGAVVNMSSILGSVGFRNAPAYAAVKHGVVGLTREAALTCLLLSDRARFINGSYHLVDGGYTAR